MTAIKSQYSRTFEQLAAKRRQALLESLAGGLKRPAYWRVVGEIQGLDDALKLSEEADYQLSGESDASA